MKPRTEEKAGKHAFYIVWVYVYVTRYLLIHLQHEQYEQYETKTATTL